MKNLILVLCLACVAACSNGPTQLSSKQKSELETSVKNFVKEYVSYFEQANAQEFMNCFSQDAILLVHNKASTYEEIQENIKNLAKKKEKNEEFNLKCNVEILDVLVQSPTQAIVSFFTYSEFNEKWKYKEGETHNLELRDGKWKIVMAHMSSENKTIEFNGSVADEFKNYSINDISKHRIAKYHGYLFMVESISLAKKSGMTAEEYGTVMGKRFAPHWDKSKGTPGFIEGYLRNLQAFSNNIVVQKLDSTHLKAIYDGVPEYVLTKEVSEDDVLKYMNSMSNEIADYMWANIDIKKEGENTIITIDEKK